MAITGTSTIRGYHSYVTVAKGGKLTVASGGNLHYGTTSAGGVIVINAGASSYSTTIWGQEIVRGVTSSASVYSGGVLTVMSGGAAFGAYVTSGGKLNVGAGGKTSSAWVSVSGEEVVRGVANGTNVGYGGKQTVAKGGVASSASVEYGGAQVVQAGGKAIGTVLGGSLVLAGVASNVQVGQYSFGNSGAMTVKKGGVARNTSIIAGKLTVAAGGVVSATTVSAGVLSLAKGGTARGVTLYGSGKLATQAGASVTNIVASGGSISFGKNTTLTGTTTLGGGVDVSAAGGLTIKSGATLNLSGGSYPLYDTHVGAAVNVAGAKINVTGSYNSVLSLTKANAKTTLNFDLRDSSIDTYKEFARLTVGLEQSFAGKVSVNMGSPWNLNSYDGIRYANLGEYKLSDGLNLAKNASVTIKCNNSNLGSVKVGGTLKKNGVAYKLTQNDGGTLTLNTSAVAGVMRKGTARNDTLAGGANCDIFYGGAGNDVIKGVNGHDIVFYDAKKWGKDTIAATNGTVTLYMAGLTSSFVTQTKKGKDLVLTRNGVAGDAITIRNYSENTHNIIFGGTVGAFSKYLNAAKPTAAVQNSGRDALWLKTGLLASPYSA